MDEKMASLGEKNEYEKIMKEYDNVFGFDLGLCNVTSKQSREKCGANSLNSELMMKKR